VFFNVRNPTTGKQTHCGVQEFTAEQGTTYFPYWMMRHLGLAEGAIVVVRQVELIPGTSKTFLCVFFIYSSFFYFFFFLGTYCKIQPHSKDFLDISNPRAVLEKHLRDYSCEL
jgi:ubiquitin fusion degradation protein 1